MVAFASLRLMCMCDNSLILATFISISLASSQLFTQMSTSNMEGCTILTPLSVNTYNIQSL